jgi:GNAT superfamily N-acetyltransferase
MTHVFLRDGSRVLVRPIEATDTVELQRAFALLSERSRYTRFMTGTPALSDRVARSLTDVDHRDHEALVALTGSPGAGGSYDIVAVARYVRLQDVPSDADLAITVSDQWQGRGLGRALLARLGERARAMGIVGFTVDVLLDNPAALGLVRSVGGSVDRRARSIVGSGRIALVAS